MKKLPLLLVLLIGISCLLHYRISHAYRITGGKSSALLYLPSGKYLRAVSLGNRALMADYVYLWSIQYFTDPDSQTQHLKHTYDVITELDPYYIEAYQVGAMFMFYEGRNPEAGLDLLEAGMAKNPAEWILPVDAGFFCMINLQDYARAAKYFERASKIPTSSSLVKRLLAGSVFRMGDKAYAYEIWRQVYQTEEDESVREIALHHIHDLRVLIDLESLEKAIGAFRAQFGKNPLNLQQLRASGLVREIPSDPEGDPYKYSPSTGAVTYAKTLMYYGKYQQ